MKYVDYKGDWVEAPPMCVGNACVRYARFGDVSIVVPDEYYYYEAEDEEDDEWRELAEEPCFHLPAALGSIAAKWNEETQKWTFGHSVAALQVGEDMSDFDSWIFFQYLTPDIVPGDSQMPTPGVVKVYLPTRVHVYGYSGEIAGEWSI